MAASADSAGVNAQLSALFDKLNTYTRNSQHKKSLKVADEILALAPKDEDALKVKISALVQLADYAAALDVLGKNASIAASMPFDKAYCLYRVGKVDEGLAACDAALAAPAADGLGPAWLELRAQLLYRLGRNRECIQAYDTLFQQHKADSLELKTNVLAAYVAAQLSHEVPDLMTAMKLNAKQGFEVGFNKACSLVEAGDWAAAETELRMALKLGRETLFEEDYSEEAVEDELAPLTVQLAYVLGRQKRGQEAQELYDKVLRSGLELSDEAAKAVASNNSVADSGRMDGSAMHRKSVASAVKKLEALADKGSALRLLPSLESRLSPSQKRALHLNRALLYLHSNRMDSAREVVAALARQDQQAAGQQGGAPAPMAHLLALLQAALLAHDGKLPEADAVLEQYVTAYPGSTTAVQPMLARVQLALEGNAPQRALELLAALPESSLQMTGAVVATRLQLHQQLGDTAGAEALLEQALAHWQAAGGSSGRSARAAQPSPAAAAGMSWCLQHLMGLKVKLGKLGEAAQAYAQLQALGLGGGAASVEVLAKLTRAMAGADPDGAAALAKSLPSVAAQVRSLDVDALEDAVARGSAAAAAAAASGSVGGKKEGGRVSKRAGMEVDGEAPPKAKKPRKRKPRYPQGYDPSLPNGGLPSADPERWLPKWERSDYKKKKKKSSQREREAVKGSQGAGKVDESLDRTKAEAIKVDAGKQGAKPVLPARPAKKSGKR